MGIVRALLMHTRRPWPFSMSEKEHHRRPKQGQQRNDPDVT